jgi:hypothetical protein
MSNQNQQASDPIGTEGSVFRVWKVAAGEITLLGRVRALNEHCATNMANVLWFVPAKNLMVAP